MDYVGRQHFPDKNAVITAVRKWVASTTDFYKCSMQVLVYPW
jgi:hypothetical protein